MTTNREDDTGPFEFWLAIGAVFVFTFFTGLMEFFDLFD